MRLREIVVLLYARGDRGPLGADAFSALADGVRRKLETWAGSRATEGTSAGGMSAALRRMSGPLKLRIEVLIDAESRASLVDPGSRVSLVVPQTLQRTVQDYSFTCTTRAGGKPLKVVEEAWL